MYHNVSRGASPSSAPRASKIDLENIEELQDAWCRRYEMLRNPPAPPELNSPRSLRACTIGCVNPHYTLQKLSLKQHLFRVLGNANMLSLLPTPSSTEYKVLLQSALRSFQEVAVGLGTSQEKLAAYIAFRKQEELRTLHIVSLRELRRQLVAEEVYADGKRHHPQPRRSSRDGGTSARSNASASRRDSSARSLSSGQEGGQGSALLWSSKVVEEKERSRHASVSSLQDFAVNVSGHPISPITTTLSASLRSRAPLPRRHGEGAADTVDGGSVTPPTRTEIGAAAAASSAPRGAADVTPIWSPAGKLPYKPRDVASLNSSYFGNRSIQSNASNPSGAALPTATSTNTSITEQTPRRPVLAQKHARYPLVPPPPTQNLHSSPAEGACEADREVLIEATVTHDSVPGQDLSVVSLDSGQLEVLLNPKETYYTFKALPSGATDGAVSAGYKDAAQHAVKLFHEENATSSAAAAAAVAAVLEPATTAADGQRAIGGALAPSSQHLTPRHRSGFTNHLNSPKRLVPNFFPRTKTAVSGSDHPAAQAGVQSNPHLQLIAASSSFRGEVEADPSVIVDAAALLWTVPPPMSPQERQDGFVYYCANPTRTVTKFYGGARFPIAGAVQL